MYSFDLDRKRSHFWEKYGLQNIFAASYDSLGRLSKAVT